MKEIIDGNDPLKAHKKKTPLKSIRKYCLECCLEKPSEVRLCAAKSCPLWHFRMGNNPFHKRKMTTEQLNSATKRLDAINISDKKEKGLLDS